MVKLSPTAAPPWLLPTALVLALIWLRPGPNVLYGIDAGVYAQVAREMAERPWTAWPSVTENGHAFIEHPPGFMWLESLFFRAFGATPTVAVSVARCLASGCALLVLLIARRFDEDAAATSLVMLATLSGFLYESQNPMLETPLALGTLAALLGALMLREAPARGTRWFVAGFVWAFWVKGPPAFAALLLLMFGVWRLNVPRRKAQRAAIAAVIVLGVTVACFELARYRAGIEPFFPAYLRHQVWPSLTVGRNNPVGSPLFYPRVLWRWYPVGLLGAALSALLYRRLRREAPRSARLCELGWAWVLVFVLGFAAAKQKYQWYTHPTAAGFAWILGAVVHWLARDVPARYRHRALASLLVIYIALLMVIPDKMRTRRPDMEAFHRAPAPVFADAEPHDVANCSNITGWYADHMFVFLWDAHPVACDATAPYRFDGRTTLRTTQSGS